MTRFRLQDILDSTGAVLVRGEPSVDVSGVSTDTRSIGEGDLFFALAGPNFDGNRFADDALASGAGAVIVRDEAGVRSRAFSGVAPVATKTTLRTLCSSSSEIRRETFSRTRASSGPTPSFMSSASCNRYPTSSGSESSKSA